MWIAPERGEVRYRHVKGITRGMDVVWRVEPESGGTRATIVHEWTGPAWPAIGGLAASTVIGPLFVSGIASRTGGIRSAQRPTWLSGAWYHRGGNVTPAEWGGHLTNAQRALVVDG